MSNLDGLNNLEDWKRLIIKEYLGLFYTKPLQDKKKLEILKSKLDIKEYFQAFQVDTIDELKQVAQYYLMSFNKRLFWKAYNTYELVEEYWRDKGLLKETIDYDALILYHGISEFNNKSLGSFTSQVIDFRKMNNKHTIFLTTKESEQFKFEIEYLWGARGKANKDILADEV